MRTTLHPFADPPRGARTLADLRKGARGFIEQVPVDDDGLAAELAALRLLPGEEVEVVQVVPFGGPLLVQTAGGLYAVGRGLARRILLVGS